MPIFTPSGPDIPEQLLHAQEEGRVVFFCGAGISVPAGLPLFGKLVKKLYAEAGIPPNLVATDDIKNGLYDRAIEHLEQNFVAGRQGIRQALRNILVPDLSPKYALTLHKALLTLGTDRNNVLRIVTTNYDHLFRNAASELKRDPLPEFSAPLLPVPKPSLWDGLVYIHGVLPDDDNGAKLESLVLSSSDFGRAYLTERWASRFVTELFKNYCVCFVGYSLNDSVMRYMVDAMAADRERGDAKPDRFYAFDGCFPRDFEKESAVWRAKNIIPILYDRRGSRGRSAHARLYMTFDAWASTYRDGFTGKNRIIAQYAANPPLTNLAKNDEVVGKVLWALTEPAAAKFFAEMKPVPSLKWLEPLSTPQFSTEDLSRFGLALSHEAEKLKYSFSFLDRPAPHTKSRMKLVYQNENDSWDDRMEALGSWLLQHLNNPELALWLSQRGGRLNTHFAQMIEDYLVQNESPDSGCESHGENLDARMRIVWDLFLSGKIGLKSSFDDMQIYSILKQIRQNGLTYGVKMQLRDALSPYIILREPSTLFKARNGHDEGKKLRTLFDYGIQLRTGHVWAVLENSSRKDGHTKWIEAQPSLLSTYTLLLRDTLDLKKQLGDANENSDFSYIHQPSIEPSSQNKHYNHWTVLIELTRDAWLATSQADPDAATRAAHDWWHAPYPLFKRLALFACKYPDIIPVNTAVEWLSSDTAHWLWSFEVHREVMHLLNSFGSRLEEKLRGKLEKAILAGPPRGLFNPDLSASEWKDVVDEEVWLRLATLRAGGTALGSLAQNSLLELSNCHPEFTLQKCGEEEFSFWAREENITAPSTVTSASCDDLAAYIMQQDRTGDEEHDDWYIRCQNNFETPLCALRLLADKGIWPVKRWESALYAQSGERTSPTFLTELANLLLTIPKELFSHLTHPVAYWLYAKINNTKKSENTSEELTVEMVTQLCKRILDTHVSGEQEQHQDLISAAINHPIGKAIESLVATWTQIGVADGQGIASPFRELFEKVLDLKNPEYLYGQIILYMQIVLLYRVDPTWTKKYLLPQLSLKSACKDYNAAWQGFLFSPRLYLPFITEIKDGLRNFAACYNDFGESAKNYAEVMTHIALNPQGAFTIKELHDIFAMMPATGLVTAIHTLNWQVEKGGEQAKDFWDNRVELFFNRIWPNECKERLSAELSEAVADFCVNAGEQFGKAMKLPIKHWLRPIDYPAHILYPLAKTEICKNFPEESLVFLNSFVGQEAPLAQKWLKFCLESIQESDSLLKDRPEFYRLWNIAQ